MKRKSALFLLVSIVFILLFVIGFLLVKNRVYKNQNRELLLKSDPIMSANIKLKDSVAIISKACFKG